uniref:Uncharacterized protein n=1 Tax=Solanum tuberosum TaxID=4113 RepID=M1DJP4_SOLTU
MAHEGEPWLGTNLGHTALPTTGREDPHGDGDVILKGKGRRLVNFRQIGGSLSTLGSLVVWGEKGTCKGKGPTERSPGEVSSDSMGIYDTHITTSEFDNEGNSGCRSPVSISEPDNDQTFQRRRAEMRSKAFHDPTKIPVTPTPPPPPAQMAEQAPPVTRYKHLHLEAIVFGMIEKAIDAALAPIWAELREHRELISAHGLALDSLTIPPATTTVDAVVADEDAEFDVPETDEEELGT